MQTNLIPAFTGNINNDSHVDNYIKKHFEKYSAKSLALAMDFKVDHHQVQYRVFKMRQRGVMSYKNNVRVKSAIKR